MEFRDLKKQYQVLKEKIDKAVIEVMTDCNFISGRQIKELEEHLATNVGVKHCITCANSTDALLVLLMAWDIKAGDAVFIPDYYPKPLHEQMVYKEQGLKQYVECSVTEKLCKTVLALPMDPYKTEYDVLRVGELV